MKHIDEFRNFLMSKKIPLILTTLLCVGIFLVFSSNNRNSDITPGTIVESSQNTDEKSKCESELESILSQIKGVGDVQVMIVYSSTDRKILEKDVDSYGNEKTVTKNESSDTEPFVVMTKYPDINGIIVVARGGSDNRVKNIITECVSDVMGVPVHKVKVLEMK